MVSRNLKQLLIASLVLGFLLPGLSLAATQSFSYTGSVQTWTVPVGVTSIQIDMFGGKGGNGCPDLGGGSGANGGEVAITSLPVISGSTLYIYIGGQGQQGPYQVSGSRANGGFNGGGTGGASTNSGITRCYGGGGGGASDIRQSVDDLAHRIAVAGGGGAGSGNFRSGGAGGGTTGGSGGDGTGCTVATGGSQVAGGTGGSGSGGCLTYKGGDGGSLNGGSGTITAVNDNNGGGGGGGYFGGGGGALSTGSGGGGSSFATSTATGVTHTQSVNAGDGSLVITYTPPATGPTRVIKGRGISH